MKEYILSSLTDLAALDLVTVILNNSVALLLALFLMFTYWLTYSGVAYSKKANVSLGMMVIVTTMVMCVIGNNVALSLGMVGALSIIRFRTAVKDIRDATFIFWGIAMGICCGVSQYMLAVISSIVLFAFLLAFKQFANEGTYLLVVRAAAGSITRVEAAVESCFGRGAHQTMKNATDDFYEVIYQVKSSTVRKAQRTNPVDIVETLQKLESVQSVSFVEQTEDIGR